MELIATLRLAHLLGATILFGTGVGIAFFMFMAHRTRDAGFVAQTAHVVVIADYLFTASAVVVQPVTGYFLASAIGWPLNEPWLLVSLGLYVLTGLLWLPVVWMQVRMRNLARTAVAAHQPLPASYHRLFRIWFACGIPAFASVVAIFGLMVFKPAFWVLAYWIQ